MAEESFSTQLIDEDGQFNERGIEAFKRKFNLNECGLSYAVVSIMGPQSGGKSTLLNHLFRTNFREMDGKKRKSQTTKGIWLARGDDIDPCTIVLDLEGSDGRERGEGDTNFEKHTALFALAVSDIVLINMWYNDIGREHAAQKPLLKRVFQVMTHLFSPRKTTLLFVIRDTYETPLEVLEGDLREDMQKIWDSIRKPEAYSKTPLVEIFNVEVVALASYKTQTEQFEEQVASLRQNIYRYIAPGGLVGDQRKVVPAAVFFFSAQEIWKCIKENKDLNLPAHNIMVANFRCEEIAEEKFAGFSSDETWRQLKEAVQHDLVPHFGQTLRRLLDKFLSGYAMEAQYFDDGVKSAKRTQLESKILQLAYPAYESMLNHLRSKTLRDFDEAFNKALKRGERFSVAVRDCTQSSMSAFNAGCEEAFVEQAKWDCLKAREETRRDIDAHVALYGANIMSQLNAELEGQLRKELVKAVEDHLDVAGDDTWAAIRELLNEYELGLSRAYAGLCEYGIDAETTKKFLNGLERYARNVVESKMREEAASEPRVLIRMRDRFVGSFTRDPSGMPRNWTGNEDIKAIKTAAHSAALKLLSVMAAIRMDDNTDNIDNTLSRALLGVADNGIKSDVNLASDSWKEVPATRTLMTPVQCKSLWRQFVAETEGLVTQAMATQEATSRNYFLVEMIRGRQEAIRRNNNLQQAANRGNNLRGAVNILRGVVNIGTAIANIATAGLVPNINF